MQPDDLFNEDLEPWPTMLDKCRADELDDKFPADRPSIILDEPSGDR